MFETVKFDVEAVPIEAVFVTESAVVEASGKKEDAVADVVRMLATLAVVVEKTLPASSVARSALVVALSVRSPQIFWLRNCEVEDANIPPRAHIVLVALVVVAKLVATVKGKPPPAPVASSPSHKPAPPVMVVQKSVQPSPVI